MIYENIQYLESEEKKLQKKKGDKKGRMESLNFALSMSIRVYAVYVDQGLCRRGSPCSSVLRPTPRPYHTAHTRTSERQGQEDLSDLASCAMWKSMGGVHCVLGLK